MEPSYNPCLGCMSMSCAKCTCAGENEHHWTDEMVTTSEKLTERKLAGQKKRQKKEMPVQKTISTVERPFDVLEYLKPRFSMYIRIPEAFYGKTSSKSYAVIAKGDGMRLAGIRDGDYLIFDSQIEVINGDIVMAKVNGEEMCRRIFREGAGTYRIRKEDGETPDIITSDCLIFGVMVGLSRSFNRAPAADPIHPKS